MWCVHSTFKELSSPSEFCADTSHLDKCLECNLLSSGRMTPTMEINVVENLERGFYQ
jgi:hypothetical protein